MSSRLTSILATLERLTETRRGAFWIFAAALAVYGVQSIALPLIAGRDVGTYLRYYVQMGEWGSVLPMSMLYRTPVAPLVIGVPLDVAGGWLAMATMALLFAGSIVAWSRAALAFGPRAGLLVAAALLIYPGYGILFHQLSSDSVFAAAFAGFGLAFVRAVRAPSAARFVVLSFAIVICALTRPGNQVLLLFGLVPLVLPLVWRRRVALAAAAVVPAALVLAGWAVNNGLRYDDYAVARGGKAYVPFFRAFVEDRIVRPENGDASRELAELVERELLDEEPYRSYGVDVDTFFERGSDRMFEDVLGLSDRVWGWESDYAKLREVGVEAVRAHPGSFAGGVAATMWSELWKPLHVALSERDAADDAPSEEAPQTERAQLPQPTDGDVIPAARQGFYSTTPDGSITEVWTSPTEHEVVFVDPAGRARFDEINERMSELADRIPPYAGSATLTLWLSRSSKLWPRPVLWLGVGVVALAVRRPRRLALAVALAAAGLAVVGVSALGTYAIVEIAVPVVPAFVVFAAAGLVGGRDLIRNGT